MTTTDNPLPVILIGLITAALLLLPPVGHDVKLPKDTVATQPPAPPGFAHWAAPTGESWKRAAGTGRAGVTGRSGGGGRGATTSPGEEYDRAPAAVVGTTTGGIDKRREHTRTLHELLTRKFDGGPESLAAIASARRFLQPHCLVDATAIIQGSPTIPPMAPMVRAIDIFVDTRRSEIVLGLMRDLLQCGAEPNPVETYSKIDVLTRSASIASLEVMDLVVNRFHGRSTTMPGWAALARPEMGIGYVAAVRLLDRSVPMSVDLFRSRQAVATAVERAAQNDTAAGSADAQTFAEAFTFPTANVHPRDLLQAGPSFAALVDHSVRLMGGDYPTLSLARYGPRGTGAALEELSAALFRQLLRSGSPLELLASARPTKDTVLHLAAASATGLILREVAAFVSDRVRSVERERQRRPATDAEEEDLPLEFMRDVILPLRAVLRTRNVHGRTPAHVAALLHGTSGNASLALADLARLASLGDTGAVDSTAGADILGHSVHQCGRVATTHRRHGGDVRSGRSSASLAATGRRPGGKWDVFERAVELESSLCDIEERYDIPTPEEFRNKYILLNRPVVIRAALQQAGYNASTRWSLAEMLRQHGQKPVAVGDIPYWKLFNTNGSVLTLLNFLRSFPSSSLGSEAPKGTPDYAFSSDPCTTWLDCDLTMLPSFVRDIPGQNIEQLGAKQPSSGDLVFADSARTTQVNKQFYLGGPRTGAPFHFHYDAVNVLAFGEKRWFLQPPAHAEYSIEPPLDWLQRRVHPLEREGELLECVQRDGDVIFVPASWGHATLNVEASIGVAFELRFDHAALDENEV